MQRKAGVVLPLFSIRTGRDWGIGQLTDLTPCAQWVRRTGHRLLQILPPHELSAGETSPYGALTAFGIDPIYIDVEAIEDLDSKAIAEALGTRGRSDLERVRAAARVDYRTVRALKFRALQAAFERFYAREWLAMTPRAKALASFIAEEHAWLDDFALYTTLRKVHGGWGWTAWPDDERERSIQRLAHLRAEHARPILECEYVQWVAIAQWERARADLRALGVELMGDLPFVVGTESADVWSHASQFQLRLSLGAPPDDYSADGQDWGLPPFDWLAMENDDLAWLRARIRHAGRLYDRFRLDHVVGLFRQWVKPRGASGARGRFDPDDADAQQARGGRVLAVMRAELARMPGVDPPRIIAEDLGIIPAFVRATLHALGMPGYRVLPWERDDFGFRDPWSYPANSVASWSTHDTAPITAWWNDLPPAHRQELGDRAGLLPGFSDDARSLVLLHDLYSSSSELTLVLAQEVLGMPDRINTPGTVGEANWTWRLPRPIEDLDKDARLSGRFDAIRALVAAAGR
jgi:4-alpha-glucanotransferase